MKTLPEVLEIEIRVCVCKFVYVYVFIPMYGPCLCTHVYFTHVYLHFCVFVCAQVSGFLICW